MSAASPLVNAVLSIISASAGMISPDRIRTMSPGTTLSTSTCWNVPSRLTSALSATERRRTSAALTACPSCTVSSPIEIASIATIIDPPMASPVATETKPAARRISDKGSSSRRKRARNALSVRTAASLLRPYWASRRAASSDCRPTSPLCSAAYSDSGVSVQKARVGFCVFGLSTTFTAISHQRVWLPKQCASGAVPVCALSYIDGRSRVVLTRSRAKAPFTLERSPGEFHGLVESGRVALREPRDDLAIVPFIGTAVDFVCPRGHFRVAGCAEGCGDRGGVSSPTTEG